MTMMSEGLLHPQGMLGKCRYYLRWSIFEMDSSNKIVSIQIVIVLL